MNGMGKAREILLNDHVALQFTDASWNSFSRSLLQAGEKSLLQQEPCEALTGLLQSDLWAMQEGNNLLLITRFFVLPCTLRQEGPGYLLVAHSSRITSDGDAVNAFKEGVLVRGQWRIVLPDEGHLTPCLGAKTLHHYFFPEGSSLSPHQRFFSTAESSRSERPELESREHIPARVVQENTAFHRAEPEPVAVAAAHSANNAKDTAPFSFDPVEPAPPRVSDLLPPLDSTTLEPVNRQQSETPDALPALYDPEGVVSTSEQGMVSLKMSGEYTLEAALPQQAVDQLFKSQVFPANMPDLPVTSPAAALPLEPVPFEEIMSPSSDTGLSANRFGSPWPPKAAPSVTSSVSLSQSAIDAMLANLNKENSSQPISSRPETIPISRASAAPVIPQTPVDPITFRPVITPISPQALADSLPTRPSITSVPVIPMEAEKPRELVIPRPAVVSSFAGVEGPAIATAKVSTKDIPEPIMNQSEIDDLISKLTSSKT